MASPASTYSTVIACSLLRAWLRWAVEAGLRRHVPHHDDGPGQSPAFVVARGRAEPVIARPIQVQGRPASRMVHQPDELPVAIAGQQRTVRVQVVIDEFELDITPMGN